MKKENNRFVLRPNDELIFPNKDRLKRSAEHQYNLSENEINYDDTDTSRLNNLEDALRLKPDLKIGMPNKDGLKRGNKQTKFMYFVASLVAMLIVGFLLKNSLFNQQYTLNVVQPIISQVINIDPSIIGSQLSLNNPEPSKQVTSNIRPIKPKQQIEEIKTVEDNISKFSENEIAYIVPIELQYLTYAVSTDPNLSLNKQENTSPNLDHNFLDRTPATLFQLLNPIIAKNKDRLIFDFDHLSQLWTNAITNKIEPHSSITNYYTSNGELFRTVIKHHN